MKRIALVAGGGVVAVAICATGAWMVTKDRHSTQPAIPDVPADIADPAFASSAEQLRKAVLANPKSAAVWGKYGMMFREHDRSDEEAIACFRTAASLDPGDGRWEYFTGRLVNSGTDPAAAIPHYEAALKARLPSPAHKAATRLALADALGDAGRSEEAEAFCRQILADEPGYTMAVYRLGVYAADRGDDRSAATMLAGLTDDPVFRHKAATALVAVHRRLGDSEQASRYEKLAASLPPDKPWPDPFAGESVVPDSGRRLAMLRVIGQYERERRYDEAVALAKDFVAFYPGAANRIKLARTMLTAGRNTEAIAEMEAALKDNPSLATAHALIGVAYYQIATKAEGAGKSAEAEGAYRKALDALNRAIVGDTDYGPAYLTLGRTLDKLGRRDEAIRSVQQFIDRHPESPDGYLTLGEFQAAAGRRDEAIRAAEKAAAVAPPTDARPRQALEKWKQKP